MRFGDVCLITDDVPTLRHFYESVLQLKAEDNDIHSSFPLNGFVLNIYARQNAESDMLFDFSAYDGTGSAEIGFHVDDVDSAFARLNKLTVDVAAGPKTYPWGARSFHFRAPDGNLVYFRCFQKETGP